MSELSKDLLRGVHAISAEIGMPERVVFDLLARRIIPGAKIGGRWVSSRSKLAKHYADQIDASINGDFKT